MTMIADQRARELREVSQGPTHEEVVAHARTVAAAVKTWPEWKRRDLRFFDGGKLEE